MASLEQAELRAFLGTHHGADVDLTPLGLGSFCRAFRYRVGTQVLVARLADEPTRFLRDREVWTRWGRTVRTPELLDVLTLATGATVAVSSDAGAPHDGDLPPAVTTEVLGAIHSADVSDVPGFGLLHPTGAPHRTWAEALRALLTAPPADLPAWWDPELVARLHDRLHSHLVDDLDVPRTLLYMDLHAGNVLVDEAGVRRVVDWGEAWLGDPLLDWTLLGRLEAGAARLLPPAARRGPADHARLDLLRVWFALDSLAWAARYGASERTVRAALQHAARRVG
ncbi:phosphotransferase family protein [Cellulomonas sp. URHB0016]